MQVRIQRELSMGTYRRSIKQRLSTIFCIGLTVVGLVSIAFVTFVVYTSLVDWIDSTQTEVELLRKQNTISQQQSAGVLIGNQIQSALTDLHMVSNAERLVNEGRVPTVGDQTNRHWSALMHTFAKDMTPYSDYYTIDDEGEIIIKSFSVFS